MSELADHHRKLERLYATAPINDYFRPALRISEGRAELDLPVRRDFFHAAHALHGSVYFKALDDAAFFAVNSVVTDVFVLTVTFQVYLLRPVTGGVLRAEGRLVSASKNLWVAESELTGERGKVVARGSGSFMRSSIALGPGVGYL